MRSSLVAECSGTRPIYSNSKNRLIDGEGVADADQQLGHFRLALGAEHVFHLHRFDDGQILARLHVFARRDDDLRQQPGHRGEQEFRRVGRRFLRHAGQQFGGPGREHHHVDLRAPVEQAILEVAALDLDANVGAVDAAAEQRLAELPGGFDAVGVAGVEDVVAAVGGRTVIEYLSPPMTTTQSCFDLRLVAFELAGDLGGPLAVAAMNRAAGGHQEQRIVVDDVGGVETVRIFLGDEIRAELAGGEARDD